MNIKNININTNKIINARYNTDSFSKGKLNDAKKHKNNKIINIHNSFFLNDLSNKYKKNLHLFNDTSITKKNSTSKNNSVNKAKNSTCNINTNNIKANKNTNIKNKINNINNIKRINIKNKPKPLKNYYSKNCLNSTYNMQSHVTRDKSGKKQSSSLSNKISKEKTNFNKKFEKINNHSKTFKFMINNNNDSINKNSKNSFRINNLKKTKKLNSRNILNYNSNIYSFQYMNNNIKTINEINKKNKIKNNYFC